MADIIYKVDRARYLSIAEAQRLLAYWRQRGKSHRQQDALTFCVVNLALHTGLRASELSALNVGDFDSIRQGVTVTRLKRRKPQREMVAVPPGVAADLATWVKGKASKRPLFEGKRGRLTRKGLWAIWKHALAGAGLPTDYVLHAARHTVAMTLYEQTGDIRLVQQQLGHTSPAVTSLMYAWHTHGYMQKKLAGMYVSG